MDTLGALIKQTRESVRDFETGRRMSLEKLAERVGKTRNWISQIESGIAAPDIDLLLELYAVLDQAHPGGLDTPLSLWLLKLAEARITGATRAKKPPSARKETLQATIKKTIAQLNQPTIREKTSLRPTLENFPHAFKQQLTGILGDRREPSPKSRGDIFAYSVAITDVTFLLALGLAPETPIRSDKLWVLMDDKYLHQEFGQTHLLIIGSPAVNFAARRVNNTSVFRFDLAPEVKHWWQIQQASDEESRKKADFKKLDDLWSLQVFWQMAQEPEKIDLAAFLNKGVPEKQVEVLAELVKQSIGMEPARYLVNKFKKPGLGDPADRKIHAQHTGQYNDFAVISLAPNPFNPDYVCIMVGGIHGPGTAHAVKALSSGDNFRDHPFGGIMEIELDPFKDWPTRFQEAHWKWQTEDYTLTKLLTNLQEALGLPENTVANLSHEEVKNCLEFVKRIAGVS